MSQRKVPPFHVPEGRLLPFPSRCVFFQLDRLLQQQVFSFSSWITEGLFYIIVHPVLPLPSKKNHTAEILFSLKAEISASTSLHICNAYKTAVFRVSGDGRYIAPPADDLDDRSYARPASSVNNRSPVSVVPYIFDHLFGLRRFFHDELHHYESVQQPLLEKRSDEVPRREPGTVYDHLDQGHLPPASEYAPEGRKVDHNFHETDGRCHDPLSPNEKKYPDSTAAHVQDPCAEYENKP